MHQKLNPVIILHAFIMHVYFIVILGCLPGVYFEWAGWQLLHGFLQHLRQHTESCSDVAQPWTYGDTVTWTDESGNG